jgi:hypothetical protein
LYEFNDDKEARRRLEEHLRKFENELKKQYGIENQDSSHDLSNLTTSQFFKTIIEDFEKEHDIPNTVLFDDDFLVLSEGFQKDKRYLDLNLVSTLNGVFFIICENFIKGMFGTPHVEESMRKELEVEELGERYTFLEEINLKFKADLDGKGVKTMRVVLSRIEGFGFFLFFLDRLEHLGSALLSVKKLNEIFKNYDTYRDEVKKKV